MKKNSPALSITNLLLIIGACSVLYACFWMLPSCFSKTLNECTYGLTGGLFFFGFILVSLLSVINILPFILLLQRGKPNTTAIALAVIFDLVASLAIYYVLSSH